MQSVEDLRVGDGGGFCVLEGNGAVAPGRYRSAQFTRNIPALAEIIDDLVAVFAQGADADHAVMNEK